MNMEIIRMKKDEILEIVTKYMNNDKAKYAVMITGAWGSGKTHLYENCLKGEIDRIESGKDKEDKRSQAYISLYGVSSIEELSKEILLKYIMVSALREDKTKGNVLNGIGNLLGVVSKGVTFSIDGLNINFCNIIKKGKKLGKKLIQIKNLVICFDDLERCSIPINELFGLINNLVEHCACKVLILADEENIGRMYANTNLESKYLSVLSGRRIALSNDEGTKDINDQREKITVGKLKELNEKIYSENYLYKDIKEKVVGITLAYEADFINEYKDIVDNIIASKDLKNFLEEQREEVLKLMGQCENQNLRIFLTWLSKFEEIYKFANNEIKQDENRKYLSKIYQQFMIYSIRVACAIGKNKDLYGWKKDEVVADSVRLKDMVFMHPRGFRFIDEFYKCSNFIKEYADKAINYIIAQEKKWEEEQEKYSTGKAYAQLNSWYYLEDDELKAYLEQLDKEVGEKKYVAQNYQNILSLLVYLKGRDLYVQDEDIASIKEKMIANIKDDSKKINVNQIGSGFTEKDLVAEYDKYWNEVLGAINKKNKSLSAEEIQNIFDFKEEKWSEGFINYCRDNRERFWLEKKFIGDFKEPLLQKMGAATPKQIYDIQRAFLVVYNEGNLSDFFYEDRLKLESFINELKRMKYKGKIKHIAINNLITTLNEKLNKIEGKGTVNY